MAVPYQLVIDCADPDRLARFWAAALHYEFARPPEGYETWDDYYRELGLDESLIGVGEDHLADPEGGGPAIWFQKVPEPKIIKNRLHLDIAASGGSDLPMETRKQRIRAEAQRLSELGASPKHDLDNPGFDFFAIAMTDPEGNEFDIN